MLFTDKLMWNFLRTSFSLFKCRGVLNNIETRERQTFKLKHECDNINLMMIN